MEIKSKKPSLRFSGFTEAWEQCELNKHYNFLRGKGLSLDSFYEGKDNKSIAYGHLYTHYKEVIERIDLSSMTKTEVTSKTGDILFPGSSTVPLGTAQATALLLDNIQLGGDIILARPINKDVDPKFMSYQINGSKEKLHHIITGTTIAHMYGKDIANIEYSFPRFKEQTKIGELFYQLDHLITLHQRKHDKLVKVKTSLLEKLFPSESETYPKLRFRGFTEAWEQCKFKDTFVKLQNNSLSRADLNDDNGYAMNVHYGDVLIKFNEILDVKNEIIPYISEPTIIEKYKNSFLQNGDIIIADAAEDNSVGKCCEIAGLSQETVLSGLHTIPCRPSKKFASGYLGYYMNSNVYHDQLLPLIQGSKISSISINNLANTSLVYPKSIDEQLLIANKFRALDNLITLHQRKYEKLNNLKKSLLNMMFV